jgi:hypothetical protein
VIVHVDIVIQPDRPTSDARLAPALGLIGTFILCAAVLMAHLSPSQLKPVSIVLWGLGLGVLIYAFYKACTERAIGRG